MFETIILGLFTIIAILYTIGHQEYKKRIKDGTFNENDYK